jgi:hypothetical protein
MARVRGRDSHTGGRMLYYSIRCPLHITLGFMVGLADEVPSTMVLEPRSWVQFSPATYFFYCA